MKGSLVNIKFDPNRLFDAMYEQLLDISIIAARRMEQEAKANLAERIGQNIGGESKSSGALMESIQGVVDTRYGQVVVGISSSVTEQGQWESQMGDEEEAEYAKSDPPFNYALAVEEGTGIYGPTGEAITSPSGKEMRFWNGSYRAANGFEDATKRILRKQMILGQKPKYFMRDAIATSLPSIGQLLRKVGSNVRASDFIRWTE